MPPATRPCHRSLRRSRLPALAKMLYRQSSEVVVHSVIHDVVYAI